MQKKCYRISKILNNNAVVVTDQEQEIIVLAAGVGFGHKVKDYLLIKKDYKLYTLQSSMLRSQFEALLNEIPFDCVELTQKIMEMAKTRLEQDFKPGLIVSLADHIHFVVKTYQEGGKSHSLINEELKRLYEKEYAAGAEAVAMINEYYHVTLDKREAGAIAFHFINSEFGNDVNQTTDILRAIDDILQIVKENLEMELSESSLSYSRFIIHLKYFLQRVVKKESDETDEFDELLISTKSVVSQKAGIVLDEIGKYMEREFQYKISNTERFYLLVHLARIL